MSTPTKNTATTANSGSATNDAPHTNGTHTTNGTTNGTHKGSQTNGTNGSIVRDPRTQNYWTIDGEVYDLSCFLDPKHPNYFKHPGGTMVIEETRGLDVTFYFHSYHFKITPDLKPYKVEGVAPYVTPFSCDMRKDDPFYAEMKAAVRKEFQGQSIKPSWFRCSWILGGVMLTCWLYWKMLQGQWIGLLSPFTYWFSMGCCFHDQAHFAFSRRPVVRFLVDLYGAWFTDPPTWRAVHNYTHHVYTNILDYDADIAHNHVSHRSIPTAGYKKHFAYQIYYYVMLLLLFVFPLRFLNTLKIVVTKKYAKAFPASVKTPRGELLFFIVVKMVIFVIMCIRPFYLFSFWKALLFSVWFPILYSAQFTAFSQVNHLTESSTRDLELRKWSKEADTWAKHQILTSTNWCTFKDSYTNSLEDWIHWFYATFWFCYSIGLNYQIEHHLFPSINHEHLPRITPIVKRICKKHGIRYNNLGSFTDAIRAHANQIWTLSKEDPIEKKE